MHSYTKPLPVLVMGTILGIADTDLETASRLHREVDGATLQPDLGHRARQDLIAFYAGALQARVQHPRDDVLSLIAGCFGADTDAAVPLSVAHARLF
ncbi:MAG TPA: hypothetical protein VGQ42_13435 [Candidatus Dormibacteraeota bacterium]|nr:hypothetical protein [Candidatus Dormibacteraeota bacterium]